MRVVALMIGLVTSVMTLSAKAELIVLAAPLTDDPYYEDVAEDIFAFHVAFANQVGSGDDLLILVDEKSYDRYATAIGEDKVVVAPMGDIWMRDFTPVSPNAPVMFRYTAAGQGGGATGQRDADLVQDGLASLAVRAGLALNNAAFLNDGGNFVEDGAGNVVISRKFLRDNRLTEDAARTVLQQLPQIRQVAFIEADEQGGLEHADGVVSFVDTNTLIVNSYPEDPAYSERLLEDLRRGLPGVVIRQIVTPYDDQDVYDDRFGSACGLYTNALVTPDRVYLPQFGIPEDAIALAQVREATTKQVIPVRSDQVCYMGGGVRCMSWQLRGENAARLKAYFR